MHEKRAVIVGHTIAQREKSESTFDLEFYKAKSWKPEHMVGKTYCG